MSFGKLTGEGDDGWQGACSWPGSQLAAPVMSRDLVRQQVQRALFGREAPPLRVGRFELRNKVGEGAMGEVYAAYDPRLQRHVALKLLKADRLGDSSQGQLRLLREARALAQLAHPNIVTVYDVHRDDSGVVVTMELVRGPNLGEWLRLHRPDWQQVARMLIAAGHGLAAAHEAGLVHRDIKPDNILIGADDRPRVGDFGLVLSHPANAGPATAQPADNTSGAFAVSCTVAGTPRYMAPEQLRGEVASVASDQFSFCTTAFEALFGQRPFAGDCRDSLHAAITAGSLASVPARHPAAPLLPALQRGLRANPSERQPSMRELLAAMGGALEASAPRRPKRHSWLLLTLLLMLLAGAAGWLLMPRAMSLLQRSPTPGASRSFRASS